MDPIDLKRTIQRILRELNNTRPYGLVFVFPIECHTLEDFLSMLPEPVLEHMTEEKDKYGQIIKGESMRSL